MSPPHATLSPTLLKHLFKRLSERLHNSRNGTSTVPASPIDVEAELSRIQHAEASREIEPGKRIHEFRYEELDVRLDRDVLGLYRVTVNQGRERIYSFTIVCPPKDYDTLRAGYEEIALFLNGERHPANLPNSEWLKGHFYGRGRD